MRRLAWAQVAVIALIVAAACGGDDPPSLASGVAPSRLLAELSGDEVRRVCSALSQGLDRLEDDWDYPQLACVQQAWPSSLRDSDGSGTPVPDVARCRTLVKRCVANGGALGSARPARGFGEDLVDLERCTLPAPSLDPPPCSATVAEFETCTNAFVAALAERLRLVECEALKPGVDVTQPAGGVLHIGSIPACQGLLRACPALLLESRIDGKPAVGD